LNKIPGGYKVKDANGQSLAYVYGRETKAHADIANVLTMDEARRDVRYGQLLIARVKIQAENCERRASFELDRSTRL
jgi:hypothetical protein